MLNFVICDDNTTILKKYKEFLETIFKTNDFESNIILQTTNPTEVLALLETTKIDVLILDINLKSNITGLELAKQVRKTNKNTYLIFSTAHLEYLMFAYKLKTFDYLVKPVSFDKLEETINRLFDDIGNIPTKYIRIDNSPTVIPESEIKYIKRDGMKLIFRTSTTDYDTYSSFNKIQDKLPDNFIRCHKSFIVNTNNVKEINSSSNIITFKDNDISYIGPKYKESFMEVFENDRVI